MERTTDALLASLRATGGARLDRISFQLAVAVAADIVGLTHSEQVGMAARIRANLPTGGIRKRGRVGRLVEALVRSYPCA